MGIRLGWYEHVVSLRQVCLAGGVIPIAGLSGLYVLINKGGPYMGPSVPYQGQGMPVRRVTYLAWSLCNRYRPVTLHIRLDL